MSGAPRLMSEKKYNVQAVKDRLNAYRESERRIENQTEAIERLRTKMEGVGAQEITDMPRAPSPSNDRLTDLVYQKQEMEEKLAADVAALREERQFINSVLSQLKSADEQAVIQFRYLIGLNWYDVNDALYGAKADYLGKEDTYLRKAYHIHGQALLHMAAYIGDHG